MNTFKVISGTDFVTPARQQLEDFNRNEYTLYSNGENYYVYKDRSVNSINYNFLKTFFDNHLISNTIIKNTITSATYNLFIIDEKLDLDYIIINNKLYNYRPFIYETGECTYKDKDYYYLITDTIVTYNFYPCNNLLVLIYMIEILSEFNTIDCVCNNLKYSDFVSCTFGNGLKNDFICLSEFIYKNQYRRTRNIFNSIHTELDNKMTPSDNLITLILMFMKYNDLYNCNCKHVEFFDKTSMFDINGKYYLRDKAVKFFKVNTFKTPYDFLNSVKIDKFKVLENAQINKQFKNSDFMNIIKENQQYFDPYYLFETNTKQIGLNIPKKVYDYLINNFNDPSLLFEGTYEDFNDIRLPRYVREAINSDIFDIIHNNITIFDNWQNFNRVAPKMLKEYINNYEIFEDIYETLNKYDIDIIDIIASDENIIHKVYRTKHGNDSYYTSTFELIDEFKFLDCIDFKNIFIKTIMCIFNKIAKIEKTNSDDIINNFDNLVRNFNEQLGRFENEYFSHFAIAIIYIIYTRIEQITPDYQFMNDIIMKISELIENDVPNSSKIADEMIKVWCMKGEMISIAKCTTKTQSLFQQFLYGDTNVDKRYRKIDFNEFVFGNKNKRTIHNDKDFTVYDYDYEED